MKPKYFCSRLMVLVLAGLSAASFNAVGQVQLDGTVSTIKSSNTVSGTITVTNTTGTGQNRLMLVGISWNANAIARTISSVTFTPIGGTAANLAAVMTQQPASTTYRYAAIYSLTNPPSGQTGAVTVTFSTDVTNGIVVGVANFMNVDPTTPLGTPNGAGATGTAPTVTLTTNLNGNELVFDTLFIGGNPPPALTPGANQTQQWTNSIYNCGSAASTKLATNASVTMSWTATASGPWAIVAVPIRPSALNTNPPTVTINQAAGQADPTSVTPINFTVVFSQPVIDFVPGDVTLSGTAGATSATVTGGGATYNVAVSGMTNAGTVIASIPAGVVHNQAGITNIASISTDDQVTYAPGSIALDGAVSTFLNTNTVSSSSIVTNTTGIGQNRLMLVGITWNANTAPQSISSVTFTPDGGTAANLAEVMTQQVASTNRYAAIYSLTNPPSGQTGVVTVTFSSDITNGVVVGVANFMGVDPTTPLGTPNGASATGTAPTVTLTNLDGDELVFDTVFIGGAPPPALTPSASQTLLWTEGIANDGGAASTQLATNASVTMSWTATASGPWAIVAVPIRPAVSQPVLSAGSVSRANGYFLAGYIGTPNVTYTVQYADAVTGPWQSLTNVLAGPDGYIGFEDIILPAPASRFYRVVYP